MDLFQISAILLTASAVGSFINYKWIKLPSSISLLLMAMVISLVGIFCEKLGLIRIHHLQEFLSNINFKEIVFHGMLSFLLFAGALQVEIKDLKEARLPVFLTATISTFLSTIIIGFVFYIFANNLGFFNVTLPYALLFGAILSPTDPIAIFSIIRKLNTPKKIETTIMGESLFNDGVAIAFFLVILELINTPADAHIFNGMIFFFREVGGGILVGGVIGLIANQMLLKTDDYHVELFITLAVATGGYALAEKLHVSAPLAMVVAGIIIGNVSRVHAMSNPTRQHIDSFWGAIDEILNTVLFFLIGLEMIVINATGKIVFLGLGCILIALIARFISVVIPLSILKAFTRDKRAKTVLLTWGGLRGAISIAMVLSLQSNNLKEIFLPCVYLVVIFSIAVQGLTFSKLLKAYKMEI